MKATLDETSTSLLRRATEEAARLLDADGALVYLVDDDGRHLRFAVDAGIKDAVARSLSRKLKLPVGVGMFGSAVAAGEVIVTGDYPADRSFKHSKPSDRVASRAGIRSMVTAPLIAEGEVLGAIGAFSSRADDFDPARAGLLRALADHAAAGIANARLIARLERSEAELARRVEAQRTLAEITAQLTAIHEPQTLLQQVVDAAKRLLQTDGSHLTLMEPGGTVLRPTVVAGGTEPANRAWLVQQEFPVGDGINGLAARDGEIITTEDYLVDPRIPHEPYDQEVARRMGLRGMAAAPLRAPDGGIIGTLAVSYRAPHRFGDGERTLLQGLADQAAIAISNAELTERLTASEERYRFLVESSPDLIWATDAEGRFTLLSDALVEISGWRPDELLGKHFTSLAHSDWHAELMDRQRELAANPHGERVIAFDQLRRDGSTVPVELRAVATLGEDGSFAGAHGSVRDVSERSRLEADLRRQAAELERTVEAQRALGAIAAQITSLRDPEAVLQRTVDEAVRLLNADGGQVGLIETDERGATRWIEGPLTNASFNTFTIPGGEAESDIADEGISARAVSGSTTVWTDDYLSDPSFNHSPSIDEFVRANGVRSVIAAPLIGDGGAFGALVAQSMRPGAFNARSAELLAALADQAAIAVTNARLYEELRGRIEAQRSVAAIAAEIAALHDPSAVIQRTAEEAARLMGAESAMINPIDASGAGLDWAVAHFPADEPLDDVVVPAGEGISGRALAEGRVVWTGDYLEDPSFSHAPELDDYIRRRGTHSLMSAPLAGAEAPIGTLTVQSTRRHAFGPIQAEMLEMLALQAAVAVINARLYDELRDSERRYRFLVDYSPDVVWSMDDEGRFTFLSESLERQTGFKATDFIGRHYSELTDAASVPIAAATFERLRQQPDEPQRVRIELPTAEGGTVPVEITMMARVLDGQVVGAHGAGRDIRERERLERDLRRQTAELAAGQERAHLARELHDSVTQALFSMGLTIRSLELLFETDPAAARVKMGELRELQRDALAEMRALIFELRPQGLEKDGLVQALRNQAAAVEGRTGLSVTVEADDTAERLPLEAEEALYRIAQEALHNVVKHASASWARIRLDLADETATLSIRDDGAGFDPDHVPRGHLGLTGMRQRVDRLGGELTIESGPGSGSSVSVTIPATARLAAASAK